MYIMTHSHEPVAASPVRELREYSDGSVVEMYKVPGIKFAMADLARRIDLDPVAHDAGCVYVQTIEGAGKDARRARYYFDGHAMFDPQRNQATRLADVSLDDAGYDITVGEQWSSPLGPTQGVVEVVATPYTHGYDQEQVSKGGISPMARGRETLDWVVEQ